MSVSVLELGLRGLRFARTATLGLLKDIPEDKFLLQPAPKANHVLWILGHLAWTDDYFLQELAEQKSALPDDWSARFGMKSEPSPDRSRYPDVETVRTHLHARREAWLAWYGQRSPAELATPFTGELAGFAPNLGGLAHSLAWHEGLHGGQITVVRKALGLPPALA